MSTFYNAKRVNWTDIGRNLYGKFDNFVGMKFIKNELLNAPVDVLSFNGRKKTVEPNKTVTLLLPKNTNVDEVNEIMASKYPIIPPKSAVPLPEDINPDDYTICTYELTFDFE